MLHSTGMGLFVRHAKWLWLGWILAAAAVLLLAVESAAGRWLPAARAAQGGAVIYVDDSAVRGANDGSSWSNAFLDLQDALKIAQAGDEIRIGQGTYKPAPPNGDRTISFNLVSGVVMQGGYAGVGGSPPDMLDPVKFPTILSGDINSTSHLPGGCNLESHHVIRADGVVPGTELRGCTIQRGCALAVPEWEEQRGGGLRIEGTSALTIADCVIRDHWSRLGGGAYASNDSIVHFEHCRFINNKLPIGSAYGGGAYALGEAMFTDCVFMFNRGAYGGAIRGGSATAAIRCQFLGNLGEDGGAVGGADLLRDCLFRDNWGHFGGAVEGVDAIVNSVFLNNYAEFSGGAARNINLAVNCMFVGNSVEGPGGAVSVNRATLINCTFVGNRITIPFTTPNEGTAIAAFNGSSMLWNCVVWDNADVPLGTAATPIWLSSSASIEIRNCLVQGWTGSLGGVGNHGNDPRFVDADGPDNIYGTADDNPRLRANSPCIDSGDSTFLPPDQFDLDEDGNTTEPLPIDLDGLPRIVGANVDAGAFEFQGTPCRADIDGNGSVAVNDLLVVIVAWGPCTPGQMCNSDLDLDGEVAVNDLLAVITAWGDCPG